MLSLATLILVWAGGAGVAAFIAENQANTWLAGLSSGVVAVLILVRAPGNRLGIVFCAASVLAAVSATATAYAAVAVSRGYAGLDIAAWLGGVLWMPAFLLILAGVPLLFPHGHLVSLRWRWPAWVAFGAGLAATLLLLLSDFATQDVQSQAENPLPAVLPDGFLVPVAIACFAVTVLIGLAAVVSIGLAMRRLGEPERQQHAWFVAAVLILVLVTWAPVPDLVNFAGNGLWVLAIGVAITRYQLFDIEVVLSRAVVYGLLTAGAMIAYLAAAALLGTSLGATMGGRWAALVAAVAALALAGLRSRLQRAVDRGLYGERGDPFAALSRLGERLSASIAGQDVLTVVVDTVRQSLRLPYASVELTGEDRPASESGLVQDRTVRFPLNHAGESVGDLVVGLRRGETALSQADERLLTAFAQQAAVAAHDARVTRDLRRSRERIVLAREEERRRLRRDLHDGLGPALAGVSLGLETAGRAAARVDVPLAGLLAGLHDETARCTADVRQIVADLRPPVLDSVGLLTALRQHADLLSSRSGLEIVVTGEPPAGLPAAVEVAAYRIALEALTNTVRHAAAGSCTVSLGCHRDAMTLTLTDDGNGLPGTTPGVGLTSMRDRAEELGGTCVVTFVEGTGTRVEAVLPVERAVELR